MAGYSTIAAIVDDYVKGKILRCNVRKAPSSSNATWVFRDYWMSGGSVTGTVPSAGLGSAVALDNTSDGAFNNTHLTPPSGSTRLHLLRARVQKTGGDTSYLGGWVLFYDRLAHATVSVTQTTGSFSPIIDGTARLASGEGGQIIIAATNSHTGSQNSTFTLTYSNQAGTGGQVTQTLQLASTVAGINGYAALSPQTGFPYARLASGDVGVRTITDWTTVSMAGTGQITIALIKPIALIPWYLLLEVLEKNYFFHTAALPVVHGAAAISCAAFESTATLGNRDFILDFGVK